MEGTSFRIDYSNWGVAKNALDKQNPHSQNTATRGLTARIPWAKEEEMCRTYIDSKKLADCKKAWGIIKNTTIENDEQKKAIREICQQILDVCQRPEAKEFGALEAKISKYIKEHFPLRSISRSVSKSNEELGFTPQDIHFAQLVDNLLKEENYDEAVKQANAIKDRHTRKNKLIEIFWHCCNSKDPKALDFAYQMAMQHKTNKDHYLLGVIGACKVKQEWTLACKAAEQLSAGATKENIHKEIESLKNQQKEGLSIQENVPVNENSNEISL